MSISSPPYSAFVNAYPRSSKSLVDSITILSDDLYFHPLYVSLPSELKVLFTFFLLQGAFSPLLISAFYVLLVIVSDAQALPTALISLVLYFLLPLLAFSLPLISFVTLQHQLMLIFIFLLHHQASFVAWVQLQSPLLFSLSLQSLRPASWFEFLSKPKV